MEHSSEQDNGEGLASQYTRDMRAESHSAREALRSDLPGAHLGLGATVIVLIVVASFSRPRWALIVAGALTAWFLFALTVTQLGSSRGWKAVRRAYIATFGWGNWI